MTAGVLLVFFAGAAGAAQNPAEIEEPPWDLSIKGGVTLGTIKKGAIQTGTTVSPETSLTFGGFPLAIALNYDLSRALTVNAEIHFIADFANVQVTQTSIELGFAFHLFGGSRRIIDDYGFTEIVARDNYNVSLLFRTGYAKYTTADPTGRSIIGGSSFEGMGGLQWRFDVSDRSALSVEFFNTLFSLPASNERVTTSRWEFIGSYRFYL